LSQLLSLIRNMGWSVLKKFGPELCGMIDPERRIRSALSERLGFVVSVLGPSILILGGRSNIALPLAHICAKDTGYRYLAHRIDIPKGEGVS
jgi:hypothetical protein